MKRLAALGAAVLIAAQAGTAAAQQVLLYAAPPGSIGQVAYDNDRLKRLPPGYHDFRPLSDGEPQFAVVNDGFCHQWEKVISLQKRVRLMFLADKTRTLDIEVATKAAVAWVNSENGRQVCWWGTHRLSLDEAATRGYNDDRGDLHPVRIIMMTDTRGQTVYGGAHLR